jgi:hypothetical protein
VRRNVEGMTSLQLRSGLLAAGWTSKEVQRLLRLGELSPVRRGRYVDGPLPADTVDRHRLALAAARSQLASGAVVSHVSAAVVLGLPVWPVSPDRVHVTRARASGGRSGRLVHVHTAPLGADEITTIDEVPVTTMARTLVDLARTLTFEQAVVVLDAALAAGKVTGEELAEAALRAKGWPGCPGARRAVGFADPGSESVGESRSRVAMQRAGLPAPVLQWQVPDPCGCHIGRTDFAWPALRTVGEFDGQVKYGRLLKPGQEPGDAVFAEKVREDRIRDTGLEVVRWTWAELGPAFTAVAARLRARFRE